MSVSKLAIFQVVLVLVCSLGVYQASIQDSISSTNNGNIIVTDSNGIEHHFDETPSRVAITNTYAASVMRMLEVDLERVVGISGDFDDESLWPEFINTPLVQQSAHSEIDFESLLDSRPEIYIVFATNGMVDTNAIREKLDPVGIKVVALDFYKYDVLRDEINVIANLFGKQQEASDLFSEFDEIENMVSERILGMNESLRPQIVMEHHASLTRDPVVLTGTSQWTDMIEKAGGRNVFADLPGHTTHVDMEAIMDENPDVIMFDGITFDIGFNNYDNEDKCQTHMQFIADRPGFDSIQAIQDNRMAIMSGEFAGPMMIHGLPTLAKLLHPDLFSDINADQYLDDYFIEHHNIDRIGKFVCTSFGG
jgi:iron complex transport system substrate-binding protein